MICQEISLCRFRNIEEAHVTFSPGTNILRGDNAQGKTNLLEAICFFALGKSFRALHDREVIRFGADSADMTLTYADSLRTQKIRMLLHNGGGRKRLIEQNGVRVDRVSDMIGVFRAVLFCPEHLGLIREGPSERRNYLDIAISQLKPLYLSSLQRYNQILKQRNQLIRDVGEGNDPASRATFDSTVEFWSAQLAHEAAFIAKNRLAYVNSVREKVAECFADMTGNREKPDLHYVGSAHLEEDGYDDLKKTEETYMDLLMSHHDREIGAGTTLWGPHKDDIDITLNGNPARLYASQGQQRSLALAMKLAEGAICREDRGEEPVYLFDDVLSELDGVRRAYLIDEIRKKRERQVIITTCEPYETDGQAREILVSGGTFCGVG